MKKNSAFFNVAAGFLVFYSLYTLVYFSFEAASGYSENRRHLILSTSNQLRLGRSLLKENAVEELEIRLAAAMEENEIHFYSIRKNGEDLVYGNLAGQDDSIFITSDGPEATYETERYAYSTIREGNFQLAVGYKISWSDYMTQFWIAARGAVLKDFAFVLLGVVFIVLYSFRDLRSLVDLVKTRGARRGDLTLAKSSETMTLVRGFEGFETKTVGLQKDRDVFRTQTLGALRKELESGRKPPYDFDCTLVRTDINNFTQVFSSSDRPHFMHAINELFVGLTQIVSRYGGFVYEFIGDEALFYFKDENHENSAAVAIAALRDIDALCMRISARTQSEAGYLLRIKSSVSGGTLCFGPLVDAYVLSGAPLIESVRMLSHVDDKSENSVIFDESIAEQISIVCRSQHQKIVMLKGLKGARSLATLDSYSTLSQVLQAEKSGALKLTKYFRADDHIAAILDFVSARNGLAKSADLNHVVAHFRNFTVGKSSNEIQSAYANCLRHILKSDDEDSSNSFVLASLVSAATHLLTKDEWSAEVRSLILACLKHADRRVVANALDVFSVFEVEAADRLFTELSGHNDNRILSNLLVKEGKRDWSKKTSRKLKQMLRSESPYARASGLFAVGEIAMFQKDSDEISFSANSELQDLIETTLQLSADSDYMVAKQASAALAKISSSRNAA